MPTKTSTETLLASITEDVRKKFEGEGTGHDWWHIKRVTQLAVRIGTEEGADATVVELAALLHDIDDWKFNGGDDEAGSRAAALLLKKHGADDALTETVCDIIDRVSFKGAGVKDDMPSLEGRCVQDADRLDALGAIGIARAFAYGGSKARPLYDPNVKPVLHATKKAYISSEGTTLNHFDEKLFLLKDRMHTATGKRFAEQRHARMKEFYDQFLNEWNGEV